MQTSANTHILQNLSKIAPKMWIFTFELQRSTFQLLAVLTFFDLLKVIHSQGCRPWAKLSIDVNHSSLWRLSPEIWPKNVFLTFSMILTLTSQNLITCCHCYTQSFYKVSWKSAHMFLCNPANKQTDLFHDFDLDLWPWPLKI